jgi:hypothetical protein
MKIISIYKHLRPHKWYNDLYDKITKEEASWWEDRMMHLACNPESKSLEEMRKILQEKSPNITDKEVWDSNHSIMMFYSIVVSQAVTSAKNKKRRKKIKEWRDKDRAKDERILTAKPLKGIACSVCGLEMDYKWSDLYDRGTLKNPDEIVMFFYECPKKCKRKIIFEDGTPWISNEKNLCPVCNTERNTTVTKDNQNKMYFIYECPKCGSRQVEKESD